MQEIITMPGNFQPRQGFKTMFPRTVRYTLLLLNSTGRTGVLFYDSWAGPHTQRQKRAWQRTTLWSWVLSWHLMGFRSRQESISLSPGLPTITLLWVSMALSRLVLLYSRALYPTAHCSLRILSVFLHEPVTVNHPTDAAISVSNC